MQDWTVWAVAARYPQPGGIAEPEPRADELRRAIDAVDALSDALRAHAPAGWRSADNTRDRGRDEGDGA